MRNALSACILSCLWPPLFSMMSQTAQPWFLLMALAFSWHYYLWFPANVKNKTKKNINNIHFTSNILNCAVYFCLSDTSCVAAMIHKSSLGWLHLPVDLKVVGLIPAAYCRRSRNPGWLSLCSFRCITAIQFSWHLDRQIWFLGSLGRKGVLRTQW